MIGKRISIVLLLLLGFLIVGGLLFLYADSQKIGQPVGSYQGVPVYYNGILYLNSHGKNFAADGYFLGYKWQCVEYVKRFYLRAKDHKMPDTAGNAKDYFDGGLPQGALNGRRGLFQYRNGGNERPKPDDLLVFTDTKYGHVAIIAQVTDGWIEVIQQNKVGRIRERFVLHHENGNWFVGTKRKPAGWLRKS